MSGSVKTTQERKNMKKKIGLWIDHRKAVIVTITDEKEEIMQILSNVERQPRRDADSRSQSTQIPADDTRDRAFAGHLDIYYNEVISHLRDAESILILGPGEAKGEFKKHLEHEKLGERIAGIETVDKMTDPQIAAKVRAYFSQ
jgi:stalled ribosome rescue protein Dom34